nr:hypothetical protein BdHM001_23220 [Bdellovibrio sp. HM001]
MELRPLNAIRPFPPVPAIVAVDVELTITDPRPLTVKLANPQVLVRSEFETEGAELAFCAIKKKFELSPPTIVLKSLEKITAASLTSDKYVLSPKSKLNPTNLEVESVIESPFCDGE